MDECGIISDMTKAPHAEKAQTTEKIMVHT